jgi:hypothetical protein
MKYLIVLLVASFVVGTPCKLGTIRDGSMCTEQGKWVKIHTYESKHCDPETMPLGCNSLIRGSVLRCLDANHKYRCNVDNKWKKFV